MKLEVRSATGVVSVSVTCSVLPASHEIQPGRLIVTSTVIRSPAASLVWQDLMADELDRHDLLLAAADRDDLRDRAATQRQRDLRERVRVEPDARVRGSDQRSAGGDRDKRQRDQNRHRCSEA